MSLLGSNDGAQGAARFDPFHGLPDLHAHL